MGSKQVMHTLLATEKVIMQVVKSQIMRGWFEKWHCNAYPEHGTEYNSVRRQGTPWMMPHTQPITMMYHSVAFFAQTRFIDTFDSFSFFAISISVCCSQRYQQY